MPSEERQPKGKYFYNMALQMGGLMEDPEFHPELLRTISANSLREAKDKWAEVTDYSKKDNWDPKSQTYWGWSVICLGSNDPQAEIEKDF